MKPRLPNPRLRLVHQSKPSLGDMLQRLARIAPEDIYSLTVLTRDVLKHAEARHARYHRHDYREPA